MLLQAFGTFTSLIALLLILRWALLPVVAIILERGQICPCPRERRWEKHVPDRGHTVLSTGKYCAMVSAQEIHNLYTKRSLLSWL